MPYNTVCSYSFLEAHTGALSGTPRRFRVSFSRLNWQPAPFEIRPDGEPLELEWIDSDDNVYTPTRATRATFNLTVENWNPAVLNATGKYDIQVLIECDQTGTGDNYGIFFFGWVQPGDASDAYGDRPNGKTIYATDGLSLLKDKPVLDQSGKRLANAQISLASILQHALANTGFYRPMSVGLNLYHLADFAAGQTVNGHPDPNRCPLDTTRLASKWLTSDNNEVVNCIDAIQAILRPFGCQLGQWGGQWLVRRITETDGLHNLSDPLRQSVLFRTYTSPNNLYAGPDANSAQSIDMRVIVGRKDSGEMVRVLSGGPVETLTSPREAIKIEQNYGRYISEFPSGDLADADADGLPVGWDRVVFVPREAQRVGQGIEPDSPYQIKILGAGDNLNAINKQSIGVRIQFPSTYNNPATGLPDTLPDFKRAKKWTIKGRYQLFKARAMQMTVVAIKSDGLYLATQSGEWKKLPGKKDQVTLRFDNAFGNGTIYNPTPTDFSITLNPLDKVTNLFIRFHDPEDLDRADGRPGGQKNPDAYVLIWNLSLSTERDGLNLTGQNAIRTLSNRVKPDTLASLTLGDVPDAANPYRHLGTLYDKAGNATGIWREARETLATIGKTLINTLADDAARQLMNVQPGFEGDVIGYLPWGPFSILLFSDIGNTNTDNLFIMTQHVITRWRYKVRSMVNTVSCVRIASDSAPFGPQPIPGNKKAYWQTPDGEILQSSDDTSGQVAAPVPPSTNPFPALAPLLPFLRDVYLGNTIVPTIPGGIYDRNNNGNVLIVDSGTGAAPVSIDPVYRPIPKFDQFL